MDESRCERTPPEKENMEPFPPPPPHRSGGSSTSSKMRLMMMPLEVKRLINESSSGSGVSPCSSSSSPCPSSPPPSSVASPRGPLKTLLRIGNGSEASISSPPSASSTPYIKISPSPGEDSSRILFRTPGRSSKTRTPSGPRLNPFDRGGENLHLPVIMSPSLFATVQSPSQENNGEHFWSLEDRAALFPVHISEDSPWKQEERKLDPETEIKTQEALNHYFNHHHQITSPLTDNSASCPVEASTQTELSFPPKLPEEVEALLSKYAQSTGGGDSAGMSNVSLRRKLFTNTQGEDESTEEGSSGEEEEPEEDEREASSPIRIMSPGKVILTPPRRCGVEELASSVETERMLCSFTPPLSFTRRTSGALTQIMDSPLFSPISRTQSVILKDSIKDTKDEPSGEIQRGSTFFPYFTDSPLKNTPENVILMRSVIMEEEPDDCVEMCSSHKSIFERSRSVMGSALEDQNVSSMDTYSAQSSPMKPISNSNKPLRDEEEEEEDKKSSTKLTLDNLTSSMTFNDVSEVTLPTNYSSSTTGYATGHSNHPSLSTIAESVGKSDSGMVSGTVGGGGDKTSAPFDFFHSVNTNSIAKPKSYMLSYGGGEEGGSDISVGFPLGSSTPTKQ